MNHDAELLQRYMRENSEPAFTELVHRHFALVYAVALRRVGGDAHAAEEVAQIVFTDLARKAASLAGRSTLVGWLYLGAQHAAAGIKRSDRRRQNREQEAYVMQQLLSSSDGAADWDRVRPVLDDAMRELSDRDREAVLLRFFQQQSFATVGAALGLTEDAARMRVERALDKLHALLAKRGVQSSATALAAALGSQPAFAAPAGLAAKIALAALASPAGAGLAAAGIFMQTTKIITGAIALGALGFAGFQFNHARQASVAAADLARERDNLTAQLRTAQERYTAAVQQTADLQRDLETARKAKPALSAKPATTGTATGQIGLADPTGNGGATSAFFLGSAPSDPAVREREARARSAASVDSNYAGLYRQLGWTAEQQEQFRDLMYRRSQSIEMLLGTAVAAARKENPGMDRAAIFEVFEAVQAQGASEQVADVRGLFGDMSGQAMERYQSTGPMRSLVARQIASELLFTETPLAPAQAEQLIDVMAANARGPNGRVEMFALNVEAAAAQAQGILNPAQLAAFRKVAMRAQETARQERERNMSPTGLPK